MRVAIIHPFLFHLARGIERFTYNLANSLTQRDIEVHLLTWRWDDNVQIDTLDPRVFVHQIPTSRYYAATAVIPFYFLDLVSQHYDFVWIFFAGYGEAEALTLARRQKFGIILQYPYALVPHRYREFQRYGLAQRAAQIVSVSQFVADGAQQAFDRKSIVIPNGVDTGHFQPYLALRRDQRLTLGFDESDQVLVTVAALEERKGVQRVINALPLVLSHNPHTKYLVVGEGSYRPQLETQIRNSGLEQVVKLIGATDDIFPYYNIADVFLLLAYGEALAIAPLEAMAMRLPVIVANQPPFDELIEPAYGLRVDEADVHAVSDVIVGLLNDPGRRRAMGEAGREKILKDFTWGRVGEQYIQLLNSSITA